MRQETTRNWAETKPKLSVLIPYYKDNPCALIIALDHLPVDVSHIEIIAYNDGTNDPALDTDVTRCLTKRRLPVKIIAADINQGRAAARNALQKAARADWVLFLDADMRPVKDSFLQDYLNLIEADIADVIFGGFTVEETAVDADRNLHRALSETSDCLSLDQREAAGPQYVATSNLAVRKSVLSDEPFDPGFSGWGWEDSEWAARIAKSYRLRHVDNPALHLGLETTDTLLRRFQNSGPNYLRFTQKHPELAQSLALFQISTKLKNIPAQTIMRPFLKAMVKTRFAPMKLRLTALKLWRASWYAQAMRATQTQIDIRA